MQQAASRGDQYETVHATRAIVATCCATMPPNDAQHVRPALADGVQDGHGEAGRRGQRQRVRRELCVTDAGGSTEIVRNPPRYGNGRR
jgi:hypothetical protein